MPKIKKVHRKKRFNANRNRKRLRNTIKKLPKISFDNIKRVWEPTKSTRLNLKEMGLAYDPNQVIPIPNTKHEIINNELIQINRIFGLKDVEEYKIEPKKKFVVESLESEAKAPREKLFRLPNSEVQFVTYLLDKYDEDYKAMAQDKKNHYQLTWRQIRAKINKFKKIPEQYNAYLESKMEKCI